MQIQALARPEDALIAISTSGNSPNVVRATEKAKRLGLKVVSLVGAAGGRLAELDVGEPHIQQGVQLALDGWHCLEKLVCRLHRQIQKKWDV